MRSGRLRCVAWFIALMLVLSPLLMAGPAGRAAAQDDGATSGESQAADPADEATPTETPTETATETDVPVEVATETATDVATELPTETATSVVEETAAPTDVPATATGVPATEAPATESPATEASSATATPNKDGEAGGAVVGTGTPTGTPVVTTAQIAVTVSCQSDPETIRVTNTGAASIQLTSLASMYDRMATEPFAVSRTLKPGDRALFQAGHAAAYGTVLTKSYIFTNSAYEHDGIKVSTSVGNVYKYCDAKPATPTPTPTQVVTTDQIKVTLNCTAYAETIRVTNNGRGSIQIKGLASMADPIAEEPFAVSRTLQPGHTAIFSAGHGATYGTILTKSYIFTNSAFDKDGIRVSTSVGKVSKTCEPKPQPVGEKWIDVNLSTQYAVAYQGGTRVNATVVATGKPGFDTPTGTFYILYKYYTDDMAGCEGGECWSQPAVPWVSYFTDYGHAFHGKYWNDIFGVPVSHGCVNLPAPFAEWFYYWSPIGMRVYIHY